MKKAIHLLFGKPHSNIKALMVFYWFAVVFYLLFVLIFGINVVVSLSQDALFTFLSGVILFPIIFRLGYTFQVNILEFLRGNNNGIRRK